MRNMIVRLDWIKFFLRIEFLQDMLIQFFVLPILRLQRCRKVSFVASMIIILTTHPLTVLFYTHRNKCGLSPHASYLANAMLNYLYALLFARMQLGLIRAGFDPMAGVAHADNQYRDSFVYDVMEPIRGDVAMWLLEFVQNHILSKKVLYEKRDGGIRLTLKITPFLAETISLWTDKIGAVFEQVKAILLDGGSRKKKKKTTQTSINK